MFLWSERQSYSHTTVILCATSWYPLWLTQTLVHSGIGENLNCGRLVVFSFSGSGSSIIYFYHDLCLVNNSTLVSFSCVIPERIERLCSHTHMPCRNKGMFRELIPFLKATIVKHAIRFPVCTLCLILKVLFMEQV